jgi:hypothetical protein
MAEGTAAEIANLLRRRHFRSAHDFRGLKISPDFPMHFPPRATVDAMFVPWLWADVNMAEERQLFPFAAVKTP